MATTPTDELSDRLPDGELIDVHPVKSPETDYDRPEMVLLEVEDDKRDQLGVFEEFLASVIDDLYASKVKIDHIESFSWNADGAVVLALGAYGPDATATQQQTFNEVKNGDGGVDEQTQALYNRLTGNESTNNPLQAPDWLEPEIGTLPLGVFGSPAVTARGVMEEHNRKLVHSKKVTGGGLQELCDMLKDESFMSCMHIRRSEQLPEKFTYQITARVALFDPQYRVNTESDHRDFLRFGPAVDPIESFKKLGISSSLELSGAKEIVTGDPEYDGLRMGQYGAPDTLEDLCSYTSVMAREADLSKFVRLVAAPSTGDPWVHVRCGTGPRKDDLTTGMSEQTFEPISIPAEPKAEPAGPQTPGMANDGARRHWDAIKQTAVAFESLGYEVLIVRQDAGSRPDIWVMDSTGEVYAVEVESTTRSKPASVYTNLIRQALWGYKTIMVMVPQERTDGRTESLDVIGDWAVNAVAKPAKDIASTKTQLHTLSEDIIQNGDIILLPEGVTESEWWLTYAGRYLLLHDGELLAEGDAESPISEFDFYTPRLRKEDGRFIVEDEDGEQLQNVDDESLIQNTRASPCHRPVDLSYLEFVEAIYCYDPTEGELVEHDIFADWNQFEKPMERHEASHQEAFNTFVIDRPDSETLLEDDCRPFIRDWIGHLSPDGKPALSVYGECRQPYTNRDSVNKENFYVGAAFRYSRGLVSPDLPGLSTEPSYPDEWLDEDETMLREPLIHGLATRDDVRERS